MCLSNNGKKIKRRLFKLNLKNKNWLTIIDKYSCFPMLIHILILNQVLASCFDIISRLNFININKSWKVNLIVNEVDNSVLEHLTWLCKALHCRGLALIQLCGWNLEALFKRLREHGCSNPLWPSLWQLLIHFCNQTLSDQRSFLVK